MTKPDGSYTWEPVIGNMIEGGAIITAKPSWWQRVRRHVFGKSSLLGLLPVIVALIGSAALNISYTHALASTRELVAHSLRVNTAINDVLSAMQDIETGQRGYLITGDEAYLAPYRIALTAVRPNISRLERLVRDNPCQGVRIARIKMLGRQKLAEVDSTIFAMRTQGFGAARMQVVRNDGKRTMDNLRSVITDMRVTEEGLLDARVAAMHSTEKRLIIVILLGITIALAARMATFLLQLRLRRNRRITDAADVA